MEIDIFAYKLMILLMPGIAGLMLYKRMAVRRRSKKGLDSLKDLFSIIMISLLSSATYDFLVKIVNRLFHREYQSTFGKLLKTEMFESVELLFMIIIAIILAVCLAAAENRKIVYKVARKMKITSHYGDDDVWTFINNSPDTSWIFVRDHAMDLVYFGLVEQYSDPGEVRELLLSDVSVYSNDTGDHLYDAAKLYICRNNNEITIEMPSLNLSNANKKGEENAKERNNKTSERGE